MAVNPKSEKSLIRTSSERLMEILTSRDDPPVHIYWRDKPVQRYAGRSKRAAIETPLTHVRL